MMAMVMAGVLPSLALLVQSKWSVTALAIAVAGTTLYFTRRYFQGGQCTDVNDIDNKVVLITGGNTGIGFETALDVAGRHATVILACRDANAGKAAERAVRQQTGNNKVFFRQLDLASFTSIRAFAADFLSSPEGARLDVLINNGGVMRCPQSRTESGFETQFGTNHLGHFLLTNLLLDRLKQSAPSRIINVSSLAHVRTTGINFDDINYDNKYDAGQAYAQSKLANILFTNELDRRLQGSGVTVNALHPGVVKTELGRHLGIPTLLRYALAPIAWVLLKSPKNGAQTSIHLAVSPGVEGVSGKYWADCKQVESSPASHDLNAAKRLWELSILATQLDNRGNNAGANKKDS